MPLYDGHCEGCGPLEDVFVSLSDYEPDGFECPECGGRARRKVPAVPTVGPTMSNPLVVKQIGRTFETPAQLKQYQRENPNAQICSANSSHWRKHKDWARTKAETRTKSWGYNDLEDFKANRKSRERGD